MRGWREIGRRVLLAWALALPGPGWAGPAISDDAGLQAALVAAVPGETILLAPGSYGPLRLEDTGGAEGQPVVLRSADPAQPARLTGMRLSGVAHLVLEDLVLDYVFAPGDKIYLRPFQVLDSQDVVLRRVVLDGDKAQGVSEKADGMGFAIGLGIQRSRDVTVENCTISWFHRGLVASQSRGITVRGCNIHSVRSDGLNFAEVQGLLVENNWIHDFVLSRGAGDHADMIQLWTRGTDTPGTDITIRDNLLNSGHAGWTQSIFMRNERVDKGEAGDEMFYRNVAITGNVIINAHSHGISVGATEGLVIARNTLVQNAGSKDSDGNPNLWIPRINVNVTARNVRIERNVTPRIVGYENQPGWQVKDNFLIQNDSRAKPGYYAAVFANPGGDPSDPGSFAYRRGGPLAGAGLGAARLDADPPRPWTP